MQLTIARMRRSSVWTGEHRISSIPKVLVLCLLGMNNLNKQLRFFVATFQRRTDVFGSKPTCKAKCPIFKAIVAGFGGKVALKNRTPGVPGTLFFSGDNKKTVWKVFPEVRRRAFRIAVGQGSFSMEETILPVSLGSFGKFAMGFFVVYSKVPSRELTYHPKMAFWRWFSFAQGGIC